MILSLYRPPDGALSEFFRLLKELFIELSCVHRRAELFVVGDINLDVSVPSTKVTEFSDLCNQFGLSNYVLTPTRFTYSTATTIDICLSNSRFIANCGTVDYNPSDHLPVCCIKKKLKKKCSNPREKYRARCYKHYDYKVFAQSLSQFNWGRFYGTFDVENCWSML